MNQWEQLRAIDAWFLTGVVLFSTGHWIGGAVTLGIATLAIIGVELG